MKKLIIAVVVCLLSSIYARAAGTNSFYDSSVTYDMTGTVLNVSVAGRPSSPAVPLSILLSMANSVSNQVSISIYRANRQFIIWESPSFTGRTAAYYFDNELKLIESDYLQITKTAGGSAKVIVNWK